MGAANQYCILADIDDPETSQVRDRDSPSTAQSICVLPVRAEVVSRPQRMATVVYCRSMPSHA